jgi:anaerobic selenocysteine-containing dehydrogenase
MADPGMRKLAPVLLYRTLGPTLPGGSDSAAVLWAAAHQAAIANADGVRNAGYGDPPAAGERLFDAILSGEHGIITTVDDYDASWQRLPRGRINVDVPELLAEVAALPDRPAPAPDSEFPFVLSAGERRAFTANTIIRDPSWRRRDAGGRLRMSAVDAHSLGVETGDVVRLTTRGGSADVVVDVTDTMRSGHVSLPNGLGLTIGEHRTGVAPNDLTRTGDRDEWVGTPWHKHVPARIEVWG